MDKRKRKNAILGGLKDWCDTHNGLLFCGLSFFVLALVLIIAYSCNSFGAKGIVFSQASGFYDHSLSVSIKKEGLFAENDGEIRYTLDGDNPEVSGKKYEEKIELVVPSRGYTVYTITAAICSQNQKCTKPEVATYILGKDLEHDLTLDIVSLNSFHDNLYDYDTGIMAQGKTYDYHLGNGFDLETTPGNYNNRGKEWIRDANVFIGSLNEGEKYNNSVRIELSGGSSSSFDLKSIKVLFDDNNLLNNYFDDGLTQKSIRLHLGGQDQFSGGLRSSIASRLAKESGFDGYTNSKRAVVFLNGRFYGIASVQQNFSAEFIAEKFGLKNHKEIEKRKGGEFATYDEIGVNKLMSADLNDPDNRESLEQAVDMDDYLKYYAIQIMWNNTDWPGNNFETWQYIGEEDDSNPYTDGRVRHIIYDTDLIYYNEKNIAWSDGSIGDIFEYLMKGQFRGEKSLFKNVMASEYYRSNFISILRELINGPFATENVLSIIDEEKDKVDYQMSSFYNEGEYEEWLEWVNVMKETAAKREGEVRTDIKKYFGVDL